jgi:hypothetical protein
MITFNALDRSKTLYFMDNLLNENIIEGLLPLITVRVSDLYDHPVIMVYLASLASYWRK